MDGWDIALLVLAGYVAVVTLVRLMMRRRDQLLEELEQEAQHAQRMQQLADMKKSAAQQRQQAA